MDSAWINWNPCPTSKQDEITPESFSESLWHLVEGHEKQETPEIPDRTTAAQECNFQSAPESVRKAWIDSKHDSLYPAQSPRSESLFSFVPMFGHNKTASDLNASFQQRSMLPSQIDSNNYMSGAVIGPAHRITPNGTAPIGSEMKEMKKFQNARKPQMIEYTGHASGFYNLSGVSVVGMDSGYGRQTSDQPIEAMPNEEGCTMTPLWNNDSEKTLVNAGGVSLKSLDSQGACAVSMNKCDGNEQSNNCYASLEMFNNIEAIPNPSPTKSTMGSHSRSSSSTSSTVTITAAGSNRSDGSSHRANLNEIREAFPTPRGLRNRSRSCSEKTEACFRSGASENDEFFYPPQGAKEQFQLAKTRPDNHARQEAGKPSQFASSHATGYELSPPAPHSSSMSMVSGGPVAPAPPHVMFRRDLSSEDLAALQAHSFQAAQTQIAMAYQHDVQALVQQYHHEMIEKDKQLVAAQKANKSLKDRLATQQNKYNTDIVRMGNEFNAMQQKMDRFAEETKAVNEDFFRQRDKVMALSNHQQQHQIMAMSNVTPTNQVVFKEPATHAAPAREPLAAHIDNITPESQLVKAAPAPFTFPGANHPGQHAVTAGVGYDSPEVVMQQRLQSLDDKHGFDDKQFEVIVNIADDVFDDPSQRPGPGLQAFFRTLGFQQKGLHEAISSCFGKVEHAVRLAPLVKMTGHTQSEPVRNVIVMCQEHIEHRSEVYSILAHKDEKYLLIAGVINNLITNKVFRDPVITAFRCQYQAAMIQTWTDEEQCREADISNTKKRSWLGKQRAEVANLAIKVDGFWNWVKDHTHKVTDSIVQDIQAVFPKSYHASLRHKLWAAVNDAIRIAIRIRQDPRYYEYHFQRVGCTWDNRYMVARNPDLVGQELGNVRTPWVTRCTTRPLVKVKNFDGFDGTNSIVHKSEVLLSERKNTLRPYGRPGQFARGPRQR